MSLPTVELQAAIAVTRFGLGAKYGEIEAIGTGPQAWLRAQVRRAGAEQPQPLDGRPFLSVAEGLSALQVAQQKLKLIEPTMKAERREVRSDIVRARADEVLARFQLAAATKEGFRERWTLFWSNHFTVSARSGVLSLVVGPFERTAIRPHVFGRFVDLLKASSHHPAMLLYLNQTHSVGPNSEVAKRRAGIGLNENLAREIMELHTVGADGGYSQADVIEFAKALTGWSTGPARGPKNQIGEFHFNEAMHEPGTRQIMGRRYPEGGEEQADAVLDQLAAHPNTAKHISRKIAAHFLNDEPPGDLTARIEKAWLDSGGDLAQVAMSLIDAPQMWSPEAAKMKSPYEFLVSAYRAAGTAPGNAQRAIIQPLTVLGQPPFMPQQPNGWSDYSADWATPGGMVERLGWSLSFAQKNTPSAPVVQTAEAVLGRRLSPRTRQTLARVGSRDVAFATLLMAPEFQRR